MKNGQNKFWGPPRLKKNGEPKKKFVNWKNQICSKLPEMAKKLVENNFWGFSPLPPQKQLAVMARQLVQYYFQTFLHNPPKQNWGKMTKNQIYIKEDSFNEPKVAYSLA